MAGKNTKENVPEEEDEEEEYEIDSIIDAMIGGVKGRPRTLSYYVSWKGYGEEDNCWVTEYDAGNASELIDKFWYHNPDLYIDIKPKKVKKPHTVIQKEAELKQLNENQEDYEDVEEEDGDENEQQEDQGDQENEDNAQPKDEEEEPQTKSGSSSKRGRKSKRKGSVDQEFIQDELADNGDEDDLAAENLEESDKNEDEEEFKAPKRKKAKRSSTKSKKKDQNAEWDNKIDILGVKRAAEGSKDKATFKCHFEDESIRIVGFEELVERAPRTLCRYLSKYMDFDSVLPDEPTDNGNGNDPQTTQEDGKAYFAV